ncbi:LysR substrate-binding domain-containing protein [Aliiglaciecola sp. CAU 1673]|uniref:LysR substrate-binding domain-containing protein n=1 Tax=Aliiglaciecola sp. CAU 1673 TaxID=3032595 RepID=UPI0023DBD53E|nr:LysR substrate-binding domain-containing protein [Aliiglaciecola sp. CAU 1673]MDF2178655.1 LysR substrate-binding domain-containing protein [Aliiglaciecola sp. CAU 1673]
MDKRLRLLPVMRCFDAAARHQSYSKAADELAITQAAVSQQIRSLEQTLGVKLFVRDGRLMRLTARGNSLAEHVSQALSLMVEGFNKVQCEPEEGVLTVTTSGSFASMWLMPRLWKFSLRHPGISVRVMASPQLEDLRHSELDVAIRQTNRQFPDLCQEVLIREPVFPVCSKQLIQDVKLDHPSKIKQCWLVEGYDPGPFSWRNWFELAGLDYQKDTLRWMEVGSWEMAINAVAAGHGICLSTPSLAGEMIRRGILVKPFAIAIEPGLTFTVLHDPDSPRLSRILAFRQWLKDEVAEDQLTNCLNTCTMSVS